MKRLFNLFAAIPVVPLPAKGSSIISPSLLDARIIRSSSSNGFCVDAYRVLFFKRTFNSTRPSFAYAVNSFISAYKEMFAFFGY